MELQLPATSGPCCVRDRELSTIIAGGGEGGTGRLWNILENLEGAHKIFDISQGCCKNILSYSASNMHINTTAWPCNGGGHKIFNVFENGERNFLHEIFYHHGTFDPARPPPLPPSHCNCWKIPYWCTITKYGSRLLKKKI